MADAKNELKRINALLKEPHLLIGGLAVNQYTMRISTDIDLVIDYEKANIIIDELYPSLYWLRIDKNNDEFRPAYEIINRKDSNLIIKFGPKIVQRESYDFIDWSLLKSNAKNFIYKNEELSNILIPSVVDLSYTKLLAYLARKGKTNSKSHMDLNDFVHLTNHSEWNTIDFYSILNKTEALTYLKENLEFEGIDVSTIDKSSFFQLVDLFKKPIDGIQNINHSKFYLSHDDVTNLLNVEASNFQDHFKTDIYSMICLDIQGFRSINMKYGTEIADSILSIINEMIKTLTNPLKTKTLILGDTFIVFSSDIGKVKLKELAHKIFGEISSYEWGNISDTLFVNVYLTYGMKEEYEIIPSFTLRLLDTIADAKIKPGQNLLPAKFKKTRDWNFDDYCS